MAIDRLNSNTLFVCSIIYSKTFDNRNLIEFIDTDNGINYYSININNNNL